MGIVNVVRPEAAPNCWSSRCPRRLRPRFTRAGPAGKAKPLTACACT